MIKSKPTTSDAGYIAIEPENIVLTFTRPQDSELSIRVDFEFVGADDILRWVSNLSSKISTPTLKAVKDTSDNDDNSEKKVDKSDKSVSYIVGYDIFERSSFIDLTSDAISKLSNATMNIKVMKVSKAQAAPAAPAPASGAAKGAKGAATSVAAPVAPSTQDDLLVDFTVPLSFLILSKGCKVDFSTAFGTIEKAPRMHVVSKALVAARTRLQGSLFGDNELSYFTGGGRLLHWEEVSADGLPVDWGLHMIEVPEGKVKVPPTETELRHRYIENLNKYTNEQGDALVSFTLEITDSTANNTATNEEKKTWVSTIGHAKLQYENKLAATLPLTTDIRKHDGLWTLKWDSQHPSYTFLHRDHIRTMLRDLSNGDGSWIAHLRRKSLKEDAGDLTEGPPLYMNTILDLKQLGAVDTTSAVFHVTPLSSDSKSCNLHLTAKLSGPFRLSTSLPESKSKVVDTITQKGVISGNIQHKNVLAELQHEISTVVKEIAQEYIALYPAAPVSMPATSASPSALPPAPATPTTTIESEMELRRVSFLHHLSTSGLYHNLKERLKPRIQRVVRDRYGVRGKALGMSGTMSAMNDTNQETNAVAEGSESLDKVLGELYVFLVKECNKVLNELYHSTMIARDEVELEAATAPQNDDEQETAKQSFKRLLDLAKDAELDGRDDDAEQLHLERVQLIAHSVDLGGKPEAVFSAYFELGEFLLRRSAGKWRSRLGNGVDTEGDAEGNEEEVTVDRERDGDARFYVARAKEALELAVAAGGGLEGECKVRVELACLLIEDATSSGLLRAEEILQGALVAGIKQSRANGFPGKGTLAVVNSSDVILEFEGYDSDELSPIHPMVHVALSLLFYQQRRTLASRKALKMAIRAFVDSEGMFFPPLSAHGRPRRTVVVVLVQMSLLLRELGLLRLEAFCLDQALESEAAATEKATERKLSATTPPVVRHLLKLAQCYDALAHDRPSEALLFARDSVLLAEDKTEIIDGWMAVAKAVAAGGAQSDENPLELECEAYSKAIEVATSDNSKFNAPFETYLRLSKLLLYHGRYKDALGVLLSGCKIYSSASLFTLLGICCMRLDRLLDAEDALQEANLLDCRRSVVWAYLALICIGGGTHRLLEAERSTAQALRLGLKDANLLRELATGYISVDQLQTAEELIRRAIAVESSDRLSPSSHTRKLLGDILAGQNLAAAAVEEYQAVIGDESADKVTRIAAAGRCRALIESLGRTDELQTLDDITVTLNEMNS